MTFFSPRLLGPLPRMFLDVAQSLNLLSFLLVKCSLPRWSNNHTFLGSVMFRIERNVQFALWCAFHDSRRCLKVINAF